MKYNYDEELRKEVEDLRGRYKKATREKFEAESKLTKYKTAYEMLVAQLKK